MEQEEKVSVAALSVGSAPGAEPARPLLGRAGAGGAQVGAPSYGGTGAQPAKEMAGRPDTSESERTQATESATPSRGGKSKTPKKPNNVRRIRIEHMMSKAELARRANLSVLTIDRVERGFGCRMDTKRKILEALGLSLADRVRVFGEEE